MEAGFRYTENFFYLVPRGTTQERGGRGGARSRPRFRDHKMFAEVLDDASMFRQVPWSARRRSGADAIGAVLDSITRSTTWLDSFSRLLACFFALCSAVSQERLRGLGGVRWVLHLVAGGSARQAAARVRDHGRGGAQGDHGSCSASKQSSLLTFPILPFLSLFFSLQRHGVSLTSSSSPVITLSALDSRWVQPNQRPRSPVRPSPDGRVTMAALSPPHLGALPP